MTTRPHVLGTGLACLLTMAGCGSSAAPGSPVAPSLPAAAAPAPAPGPSVSSATISGSVSAVASGASTDASSRATPVQLVEVIGTDRATALDAAGRFTLTGVPAGAVRLRFSGPGTDATLALGTLQSGETLTIVVAVNGAQATIVTDSRTPEAGLVPINGDAISLTGSAASFEFRVNGLLIRGDAQTQFFGDGNRGSTFADFVNGSRVEVKALPREGYFYAVRLHLNPGSAQPPTAPAPPPTSPAPPPTTPPQDTSASIEGPLTALAGALPNLQLVVAGVTVRTSGSTTVQRRGDRQDLSVLRLGMTLHVVGDRQSDGSLDARFIQIKDDAPGAAFEIEGSMGGLRGTCPLVSFGVNGYSISATGSTTFTPACAEFKNGNKVRVRGSRRADGTVEAAEVTLR